MIGSWWHGLRRRRDAHAVQRRAIPDTLWRDCLAALPFVALRPPEQQQRLRRMASLFLDRKEFSGAQGLVVTDQIALAVAVQACLPVLELGIDLYDEFVGIVVHPDAVLASREVTDEHGIVHAYDEELAGEAMQGGPLMLSWADVLPAGADATPTAYNVVIHEFAHVLDMRDGLADGVPLLASAADRRAWLNVLTPEYDAFCERVVCGHETVLDPYAAEAPDEFFAVASEAFFVTPQALKEEQPALYRLLASYYRQDPAQY
jgi:Mlc titration factor MtfA (ptsG expression regulator)